jgi:hypothetical protein
MALLLLERRWRRVMRPDIAASGIKIIGGHQQLQTELTRYLHVGHTGALFVLLIVVEIFDDFLEDDSADVFEVTYTGLSLTHTWIMISRQASRWSTVAAPDSSMRRTVPEIHAADRRMWNSKPSAEIRVTKGEAVPLVKPLTAIVRVRQRRQEQSLFYWQFFSTKQSSCEELESEILFWLENRPERTPRRQDWRLVRGSRKQPLSTFPDSQLQTRPNVPISMDFNFVVSSVVGVEDAPEHYQRFNGHEESKSIIEFSLGGRLVPRTKGDRRGFWPISKR